jgi:hypothetical protein
MLSWQSTPAPLHPSRLCGAWRATWRAPRRWARSSLGRWWQTRRGACVPWARLCGEFGRVPAGRLLRQRLLGQPVGAGAADEAQAQPARACEVAVAAAVRTVWHGPAFVQGAGAGAWAGGHPADALPAAGAAARGAQRVSLVPRIKRACAPHPLVCALVREHNNFFFLRGGGGGRL